MIPNTTLPTTPPQATLEEQHEDWDIAFKLEEAHALFHAEVVLWNCMNDQERSEEDRLKRAPFLTLAMTIAKTERLKRWQQVYEILKQRFEGTQPPSKELA